VRLTTQLLLSPRLRTIWALILILLSTSMEWRGTN
jgi:hypothetical protein